MLNLPSPSLITFNDLNSVQLFFVLGGFVCLFVCLFFAILGLHLWHMEFPRLRVELEPQLLVHATATDTRELSLVCNLYHSSQQRRMLTH